MDNKLVKLKQTKYSGDRANGRPKRKSVVAQAERRTNDIVSDKITLLGIYIAYFNSHLSISMIVKMQTCPL